MSRNTLIIMVCCLILSFSFPNILYAEDAKTEGVITAEDRRLPFPLPAGDLIITSTYDTSTHTGDLKYALDMQSSSGGCASYGMPVVAAQEGIVVRARDRGEDDGFGTHIITKNPNNNLHIWYAHLIQGTLQVEETEDGKGERVYPGQLLGLMGDTGNTFGNKCSPFTIKSPTINLDGWEPVGTHLHFEIRDGKYGVDENGNPPKSLEILALKGQKEYTDLKREWVEGDPPEDKVGSLYKYISTTKVFDKNLYWPKVREFFPNYKPSDDIWINELPSSQIIGFTPLTVKAGERPKFTITGEYLPKELYVNLPGCDPEWDEQSQEKHTFTCNEFEEGVVNGVVKFSEEDEEGMVVQIEVKSENLTLSATTLKEPEAKESYNPGDKFQISLSGSHLPGDLAMQLPECEEIQYVKRSSSQTIVECTLARNITYDDGVTRFNNTKTLEAKFSDPEGMVEEQSTEFKVDYRMRLDSVSPSAAYYGEDQTFEFKGKGMDRVGVVFIEQCDGIQYGEHTGSRLEVHCRLLAEEKLFAPLMPDSMRHGLHYFVLKDRAGGLVMAEGNIVGHARGSSFIDSVTPKTPSMNKLVEFSVTGNSLPRHLIYWLDHCGEGSVTNKKDDLGAFSCTPLPIGGPAALKNIQEDASYTVTKPNSFINSIESQNRQVAIKLDRDYSADGNPITLYRQTILPIPDIYRNEYSSVKNQKEKGGWLSLLFGSPPSDSWSTDDIIDHVMNAEGNYNKDFLEYVGWKELSGPEELELLQGQKNRKGYWEFLDEDNYRLINCDPGLEKTDTMTGNRLDKEISPWLPTVGGCAQGLNNLLLQDADQLYPEGL